MKSGLKGGRADQELDEIAKSLLADESFLADDFEQMAHITTPIEAPMIPFAEFEKDGDTAKKSLGDESAVGQGAVFPGDYEERVRRAFASDGPLAQATTSFVSRPAQIEFALAVARALQSKTFPTRRRRKTSTSRRRCFSNRRFRCAVAWWMKRHALKQHSLNLSER